MEVDLIAQIRPCYSFAIGLDFKDRISETGSNRDINQFIRKESTRLRSSTKVRKKLGSILNPGTKKNVSATLGRLVKIYRIMLIMAKEHYQSLETDLLEESFTPFCERAVEQFRKDEARPEQKVDAIDSHVSALVAEADSLLNRQYNFSEDQIKKLKIVADQILRATNQRAAKFISVKKQISFFPVAEGSIAHCEWIKFGKALQNAYKIVNSEYINRSEAIEATTIADKISLIRPVCDFVFDAIRSKNCIEVIAAVDVFWTKFKCFEDLFTETLKHVSANFYQTIFCARRDSENKLNIPLEKRTFGPLVTSKRLTDLADDSLEHFFDLEYAASKMCCGKLAAVIKNKTMWNKAQAKQLLNATATSLRLGRESISVHDQIDWSTSEDLLSIQQFFTKQVLQNINSRTVLIVVIVAYLIDLDRKRVYKSSATQIPFRKEQCLKSASIVALNLLTETFGLSRETIYAESHKEFDRNVSFLFNKFKKHGISTVEMNAMQKWAEKCQQRQTYSFHSLTYISDFVYKEVNYSREKLSRVPK